MKQNLLRKWEALNPTQNSERGGRGGRVPCRSLGSAARKVFDSFYRVEREGTTFIPIGRTYDDDDVVFIVKELKSNQRLFECLSVCFEEEYIKTDSG